VARLAAGAGPMIGHCLRRALALASSAALIAWCGTSAAAVGNGWPCTGRPAVTLPGESFAVGGAAGDSVFLELDGRRIAVPVTASAGDLPGGPAMATVPLATPPGRYRLVVTGAAGLSARAGAVHVLAEAPQNYMIALVRADGLGDSESPLFSQALTASVAEASADLVIVLGALTSDGSEAAYGALVDHFAALDPPVIFCPDQAELDRGVYADVFGRPPYGVRYGQDGYLILGGGPSHADSGAEARMGQLHRWRRELRACRWSTGVAGRFGLDWATRSQLILFVDDPLDYLIAGAMPPEFGDRLPWGRTRIAAPPSAPSVPLQLFEVRESGLALRTADSPAE